MRPLFEKMLRCQDRYLLTLSIRARKCGDAYKAWMTKTASYTVYILLYNKKIKIIRKDALITSVPHLKF